ncbi:hypothetical protein V2J09_015915 [Rumex salicifolius]
MPGLAQRNDQSRNATSSCCSLSSSNGSVSANGFWSKHGDEISYNQLQKFWIELSSQARQKLLRIDKQTLFEQARKNMYCSRCNGLLLEGFMQIVMYGKSLQQEVAGGQISCHKLSVSKDQRNSGSRDDLVSNDEVQDPSVHPWGGLTTTRDAALTLLNCYLYSKSLKGLQNVFDSARARERERELLYPDACGGSGRGWISQGIMSYCRGHGTRETCALHTARLSCDTLVDFWSALGEETRQSLLRMKEEDFIERLMYRFDSKRFCRDCRRNVIREFKELKELKRMRREPRCTTWFCVADTAFQYEVSNNTIRADWHQTFTDSVGTYHHFEWAVGTGEGKSDILEYENVGMNGSVQVNGLDLSGLSACYITLRAWKQDGRCSEFSVKAHALKGEHCVHCRLMVGDGYVTISRGESIRSFFEHAEEAEEEEDDSSMDKDGNELDSECSRPQKHAKSPELAREFLLDAATVEKAFREGTARQNAHSIFVCLAVKLLEERVHVACKEIITLEKQTKLLEEEEKEKREEEERKERKRTKEREKKLRRKERLRGKKCVESNETSFLSDISEVSSPCITEEPDNSMEEIVSDSADPPASPDIQDVDSQNDDMAGLENNVHEEVTVGKDENNLFGVEDAEFSNPKLKHQSGFQLDSSKRWPDRHRSTESVSMVYKSESRFCNGDSELSSRGVNGLNRQSRSSTVKFSSRNCSLRFNHKLQCTCNSMTGRTDLHSCGCNQHNDYREKVEPHAPTTRLNQENKSVNKMDSGSDLLKPYHRINKLVQTDYTHDTSGRSRSKVTNHSNSFSRDLIHTKKVWEPVEPQKRYPRCSSYSDVTLKSSSIKVEDLETNKSGCETFSFEVKKKLPSVDNVDSNHTDGKSFPIEATALCNSKQAPNEEVRSCKSSESPDFSGSSTSSSDNCSSCLSEGDSNTATSKLPILDSSSVSDSEDGSQLSEGRDSSVNTRIEASEEKVQDKYIDEAASKLTKSSGYLPENSGNVIWMPVTNTYSDVLLKGTIAPSMVASQQSQPPQIQQNIHYPAFQAPSMMDYYHQNQQVSWSSAPTNGFVPYPHPNPYLFTSPFSYNLGGDSHYSMQYGAVQHLPSPLLNPTQIPVYQPLHSNGSHFLEQNKFSAKPNGLVNPSNEVRREIQTGAYLKEERTNSQTGNSGFSLFKFVGPVPRVQLNLESSDEGLTGDRSPELTTDRVDGDRDCSKKDTIMEEYNLFAASKGIKFSIF